MHEFNFLGSEVSLVQANAKEQPYQRIGKTMKVVYTVSWVAGLGLGAYLWKSHRIWGGILGSMGGAAVGAVGGLVIGTAKEAAKQAKENPMKGSPAYSKLSPAEQASFERQMAKATPEQRQAAEKQVAELKKQPESAQLALLKQAAAVLMAMDGTGPGIDFQFKGAL